MILRVIYLSLIISEIKIYFMIFFFFLGVPSKTKRFKQKDNDLINLLIFFGL